MTNSSSVTQRSGRAAMLLLAVLVGVALGIAVWALIRTQALHGRVERLQQQADESASRIRSLEGQIDRLAPKPQPTPAEATPAPADAYEVFVIGKQWLWKFQHPNGQREIGELHLPVGRAVKLQLISEDVIHRFTVPELNVSIEARPGQYTTTWFRTEKVGRFNFVCGEYCGQLHSQHTGTLVVVEKQEFADYLAGMTVPQTTPSDTTPAWKGQQVFRQLGCQHCHVESANNKAPSLNGLFGSTVPLHGGTTAKADEAYLRESILKPHAKVREGWAQGPKGLSIMPEYRIGTTTELGDGTITAENLNHLVAYLKTLKPLNERLERIQNKSDIDPPRLEPLQPKP